MTGRRIHAWLSGPLDAAATSAIDRVAATEEVHSVAIMPDAHLADEVCVGTVVAARTSLFPAAIGGDIGCGVIARCFNGDAAVLRDERAAARARAGLYRTVPAVRHARAQALPASIEATRLSEPRLASVLERDGRVQLGTLGQGNHFLELQQSDVDGRLWVAVHSGSRGFGQAVLGVHLPRAAVTRTGLHCIDAFTAEGRAYLGDVEVALAYADASRRAMLDAVTVLLGSLFGLTPDLDSEISCAHNFIRRETHADEELWVHRKGAISAHAGEPGVVPGSMGTPTFHVEAEDASSPSARALTEPAVR